MTLKKTSILLSFDDEALLELRRALFRQGLSPQEFFAFIMERITLGDEHTEALLEAASRQKSVDLVKGGVDRKNINADSLYEAIEQQEAQNKKDTE